MVHKSSTRTKRSSKNVSKENSRASLLNAVESYLNYHCHSGSHTERAKRLDLDSFIKFLTKYCAYSKPEKLKLKDWDENSVKRFVSSCKQKGEAPSTVARRLATLKHFGKTISKGSTSFSDPGQKIKTPRIEKPKPLNLNSSEIRAIRSLAKKTLKKKSNFKTLRNFILFELLTSTGLRVEEVRKLKLVQLDSNLEWLIKVKNKSGGYRNIKIPKRLSKLLKEYLAARNKKLKSLWGRIKKKDDRKLPLFISIYGAKLDRPETLIMGEKSIWRAINEFSANTPLNPYLLRHSFAAKLAKSSRKIETVAKSLGHSDPRVTRRYY